MASVFPTTPAPEPHFQDVPSADEFIAPLPDGDDLMLEMRRLAEEHQKLLASMGMASTMAPARPANKPAGTGKFDPVLVDKYRQENSRLTARVAELERLLEEAANRPDAANWDERQQEYETLLAEKSEAIRELRAELQEYRDRPQMVAPKEEELLSLSEQLEQDRRQLTEDEAALEEQTKNMEMTIARQRAEVGRQRTEVERMFAELQLEMDQAMRESGLRERLAPLQRRSQEFAVRTGKAAP
jgi:chromosome segregation ATPase